VSEIDFFLTAFDPSDLPGASIDPLGFDRGYTFLADKILPGLTNVANRPRYFSMLCAGVVLADIDESAPPRKRFEARRHAVLRLERFWALANVLSAESETRPAAGIRGIRYVNDEVSNLRKHSARSTNGAFKLLSRQEPYGVLGIYGAIAEQLRLVADRQTFTLTPDAGEELAKAFISETDLPLTIKNAVAYGESDVSLSVLSAWGERAHISAPSGKKEARLLADALERNDVRHRTTRLLAKVELREDETELGRIKRLAKAIPEGRTNEDADLKDALEAILAFEDSYRSAILGFERMLWLCRNDASAVLPRARLQHDPVIADVCEALPRYTSRLLDGFDKRRRTAHLTDGISRIDDALRFLERAAMSCGSAVELCDHLLSRHTEVQRGKFDGGRRKMPWIESATAGYSLTSTRTGGLGFEAKQQNQIAPHPYRLVAADAFLAAAGARA
jgi:hypothetical protein